MHKQAHVPPGARGAGAFPEVQVVQFPLGMGRPDKAGKGGAGTLAVTVGSDGGINYDAVVKQGRNRDKVVAATHGAMVPKLDRLTDGVCCPAELPLDSCLPGSGAQFFPFLPELPLQRWTQRGSLCRACMQCQDGATWCAHCMEGLLLYVPGP